MRKCKIGIFTAAALCLTAFVSISCEEENKPAHVWGKINSSFSQRYELDGDLDKKSARYYGYCKKTKDGDFEFTVGSDDRNHLTGSNAFYLSIYGIDGPPVEGAYEEGSREIKDDEDNWRGFNNAIFATVNEWSFDEDESDAPEECKVRLYASSGDGELVSDEFGKDRFDYLIDFLCPQLSVEPDMGGTILKSVEATLWFDNCD